MDTKKLIEKHQTCIEIVEAIATFETLFKSRAESIHALQNWHPDLKQKYEHDLIIYRMCIDRLKQRYLKTLTN